MEQKFETERLVLRILSARSAGLVTDFYRRNLDDFAKYEPLNKRQAVSQPYQHQILEYEQQYYKAGSMVRFFIFEKDNPFRIIGTISFREIRRAFYSSCTVGYKIDTACRRQGFATEALDAAIKKVQREYYLHRIQATVLPDNTASIRLLEKLGFEKEGLIKDMMFLENVWKDHYLYGKIFDTPVPPL